jgi:hypothetical protein
MALVEQLAFSLKEEGRGIHVLLWDSLVELYQTPPIRRLTFTSTQRSARRPVTGRNLRNRRKMISASQSVMGTRSPSCSQRLRG